MNFLVDENMPRSLAPQIAGLGFVVQDVRDIGLRGRDDDEVFEAAVVSDGIIITRGRGFTVEKTWPPDFTAGVIFVNLPDDVDAKVLTATVIALLSKRLPASLLGAVTYLEQHRALSRTVRRRK